MRQENMEEKIRTALSPRDLEILDESQKHQGHAGWQPGGETHYHIRIVADAFSDRSRVERQRMIHKLLADEFDTGLHALSLDLKTPAEAG